MIQPAKVLLIYLFIYPFEVRWQASTLKSVIVITAEVIDDGGDGKKEKEKSIGREEMSEW